MDDSTQKKPGIPLLRRFSYNSPVILTFALIALAVLLLDIATDGSVSNAVFSVGHGGFLNPLTYLRLFAHVLGHRDFTHLAGNFTVILIAGPMLEEKYGSKTMIAMIAVTALITGLVHAIFGESNTILKGASGIVFMLILLSSFANIRAGRIPITLLVCIAVFLVPEIADSLKQNDHVAHFAHIIGGVSGACFGYLLSRKEAVTAESGGYNV